MEFSEIVVIVLGILFIINITVRNKKNNFKDTEQKKEKVLFPKSYKDSYQKKYILTSNEWYEYKKLQQYAIQQNLQICPKVRLLDIIEPRKGEKDYKTLLYKVQSKHIDFVICDPDLHIKGIIELDDKSHNQPDRQERDKFVDEILTGVGYKIIHTNSITEETLKTLEE